MFRNLGGVSTAVNVTHKIYPIQEIANPYGKCDWANLRSVIKFLGLVSTSMQQHAREHVLCMLLRMSVDRVISDNVDILDEVYAAIYRISYAIDDGQWDASVSRKTLPIADTTKSR